VNFGRIIFQIVYHFWSYFELIRQGKIKFGDNIKLIIPSGNFGNGLAAFYAKELGLPIDQIVLASNKNNILTDFIQSGIYNLNGRKVINTNSPAMDILISSNIERLLFHLFGDKRTKELMNDLEDQKCFKLTAEEHFIIPGIFDSEFATSEEVVNVIREVFDEYGYVIDPHTATAFFVYDELELRWPCIIASTAEWTKFIETEAEAHGCIPTLNALSDVLGVKIPKQISDLANKVDIHTDVIEIEQIEEYILASI
jgi:threonine synthase